MVSGLVEERPLFYMHFMKWLITWGQGSILLLPIISEPSEARTESTRRKSEIMAGYCRPPLSRTAVYCFVLCTLLFIVHGLYLGYLDSKLVVFVWCFGCFQSLLTHVGCFQTIMSKFSEGLVKFNHGFYIKQSYPTFHNI